MYESLDDLAVRRPYHFFSLSVPSLYLATSGEASPLSSSLPFFLLTRSCHLCWSLLASWVLGTPHIIIIIIHPLQDLSRRWTLPIFSLFPFLSFLFSLFPTPNPQSPIHNPQFPLHTTYERVPVVELWNPSSRVPASTVHDSTKIRVATCCWFLTHGRTQEGGYNTFHSDLPLPHCT